MRILFLYVAGKLSRGDRLLHWELLIDSYSEIMVQNSSSDRSANNKTKYLSTNKSSLKELIEDEYVSQENKLFFIRRDLKNHNNGNSVTNHLPEESLKNFKIALTIENSRMDTNTDVNAIIASNLINLSDVLDVIVEATYDMYGNVILLYFYICSFCKIDTDFSYASCFSDTTSN